MSAEASTPYLRGLRFILDNREECLNRLLAATQDPAALLGPGGTTLLHEAVFSGRHAMAVRLLDFGIAANSADPDGWSVLHAAAAAGRLREATLLLDRGADPKAEWNARSPASRPEEHRDHKLGVTPLHLAAQAGAADVVLLLLSRGARRDAVMEVMFHESIEGAQDTRYRKLELRKTALDLAAFHGGAVEAALRRAGAKHGDSYREAQALNEKGLTLAGQGRLLEAARVFEQAKDLRTDHIVAHINLARTYARLAAPAPSSSCDRRWARAARDELRQLLELNRERTLEAMKGTAFDGIRPYDFFLRLQGIDDSNAQDITPFIAGKTFDTSCPGSSYCPVRSLTLQRDGRWVESTDTNAAEFAACIVKPRCTLRLKRAYRSGTWRVDGRSVVLYAGNEEFERLVVRHSGQVGDLHWPNPNDMSGAPLWLDREGCAVDDDD